MIFSFTYLGARRLLRFVVLGAVGVLLLVAPDAVAASGNDIGSKVGGLLRGYAVDVYGGLAGFTSLVFLWNRRFHELTVFLLVAIMVAWLVFAPSTVGAAAEQLAKQIFG